MKQNPASSNVRLPCPALGQFRTFRAAGHIVAILLCLAGSLGTTGRIAVADDRVGGKDADAFWYLDHREIDLSPVKGISYTVTRRGMVRTAAGRDAGRLRLWDTFAQRLEDFEGTVRDTNGQVLYRLRKRDVRREAPFIQYRLFSDDQIRSVDLVAPRPPYLIEYRYRLAIENSFFWPDWTIDDPYPRQRSIYEVTVPHDEGFRWEKLADVGEPTVTRESKRRRFRWTITDWPLSGRTADIGRGVTLLHAVPERFRMARLHGRTDSWADLGTWYWKLTRGKHGLSQRQREAVRERMAAISTSGEVARELKDWVSRRWRYVSIAVGIGGWIPHRAEQVYENGYGDCKDLSFLWISMLREFGLDAQPALIRAREPRPIAADFPKNWFDHVAVMLVLEGDTLWADLTDPAYPLGTLPPRLEDRWALVIDSANAELVKTPTTRAADNLRSWSWSGIVDEDGHLSVRAHGRLTGHWARALWSQEGCRHDDPGRVVAVLGIDPSRWEPENVTVAPVATSERDDAVEVHATGRIREWGYAGRYRMICRPNVHTPSAANRRPVFPYVVVDSLTVLFPAGTAIEVLPDTTAADIAELDHRAVFSDGVWQVTHQARVGPGGRDGVAAARRAVIADAHERARANEWIFLPGGQQRPARIVPVQGADTTAKARRDELLYRWDSRWDTVRAVDSRSEVP